MRQAVQLAAPTAAAGAGADGTLFTSATGPVTIIANIHIANTTNGALTCRVAIGGTTATAANCIASDESIAANSHLDLYGPFIVPSATAVHFAGSGTGLTFAASGYESAAGG